MIISWTWEEVAQLALRDYNKNHGTYLELVRVLDDKVWNNFLADAGVWKHINFEARRRNVGSNDNEALGNIVLVAHITFVVRIQDFVLEKRSCETIILSEQDAIEFAEFAIHDYNEKHRTNLKLEMALEYNRFEGLGVLMGFTKKKTTWVHMNLVARVGPNEDYSFSLPSSIYQNVADYEYVLATLALVNTSKHRPVSKKDGLWCRFCPDGILHPMKGYFYNFYPPDAAVENLL
ncbi:cystatin/monellin superfamily protein [Striga asiatica]|uniref:Cystatin/monellin superfamily protein n=1 Tax=Striga asiatica TaxID=4170 RepID=A0A5A7P1S7_STRAF|nr:cystatin/monellin superfamily protein [Striga asiatica]